METNTYRINSTWFWHHIDPFLCKNFSCRSKSTEKPILAVTDLPAIIRENCSHLEASSREKLLSVLLRFELLFNGTLGDWNLPPASFELKEGMKPYHGRPYSILHKHKAVLMKEN
jgi:hypothetical protein